MTIFDRLAGAGVMFEGEGAGAGGAAGTGGDAGAGAAGAAGGAAGAGAGGAVAFDWATAGLDAEHLQHVQAKGYRTPADVVAAHRSAEKLLGVPADQVVRLPQGDDPAMWRPVYERLGAGKTADEYKLPVPEGDKGDFAKVASGWFHKHAVPVKQAQALAQEWNEFQAAAVKEHQTQVAQREQVEIGQLNAEWGQNRQANETIVNRAAETFGMTQEQLLALRTSMGPAAAMKFMLNIGSRLPTDDSFIGDRGGSGFALGGSPDQAKAEIEQLRGDPEFAKKFVAGDAEARNRMKRLHQIAYPDA